MTEDAISLSARAGDAVAFTEGTHRACPPDQTWERLRPLLPTAGITRVADVTWLDPLGIPVWQAIRPDSRLLSVSQGKGISAVAAKVSAVMESLEVWHAEQVPVDVHASAADLGLQYDARLLHRPAGSLFHDRARLGWVAATGVLSGTRTWVPHQLVELDFRPLHGYLPPYFMPTSTGLAAGNTWAEATLHGLLEVLERESLCAAAERPERVVDLATVTDRACRDLVDEMVERDGDLVVLDCTVVGQVPCYSAVLRSRGLGIEFDGSGAHLDGGVALSRALTEAVQSRVTCISGAREDIDPGVYRVLGGLLPAPREPEDHDGTVVAFRAGRGYGGSIGAALARVARLTRAWLGHEPLVVRLDRGVDLPVVRVVVPGARRDETGTKRSPEQAAR